MYALVLKLGGDQCVRFPISHNVQRVGRDPSCEIFLEGDLVSRYHAEVVHEETKVILRDMGSTNGTLVNGQRLTAPAELKQGDEVAIGPYKLIVVDERERSLQETMALGDDAIRHLRVPAVDFPPDEIPPATDKTQQLRPAGAEPPSDIRQTPRLVFLSESQQGHDYPLVQPEVHLGRARTCEVVIDHPAVSAQHAKIVHRQGGYFIYDTRSLNGVQVNGQKVRGVRLQSGDEIMIGECRLRFEDPAQPAGAADAGVRPTRKSKQWATYVVLALGLAILVAALILASR